MKILIAEDDVVSVKVLQIALESSGHEVVTTDCGESAWAAFDAEPVRVIVSDWMMPGLDGLDFCRQVRARPKTDYTYFILLTANHTGRRTCARRWTQVWTTSSQSRSTARRSRCGCASPSGSSNSPRNSGSSRSCFRSACCKKIRDDENYWHGVETYISQQTGSNFSHGICPECFEKHVKFRRH